MLKLFSYLKKYYKSILLIVCLLVAQAFCDLSLPTYTSNIINIGVSQGGIEEVSPKVIRKSELEKLLLFVKSSDQDKITANYKLISKENGKEYEKYHKKYKALEKEDLYLLDTKNQDRIEEMDRLLRKAILVVSAFSGEGNTSGLMQGNVDFQLPEGMDPLQAIQMMPEEQREEMLDRLDEKFEDYPEMILDSAAVYYVKAEYQQVGMNTDRLQSTYILIAGAKMIGLALLSMAATVCVGFFGARVAANLARDLRSKVFKKVLSFSSTEMKNFGTASLITRSTNDIQQIQQLIVMSIRTVIYAPILGIGAIFHVLRTNASMAWIIAVAVGAILAIVGLLFVIVMPKFNIVQKLIDKLNLVSREILNGVPVIRAFSNQKHEEERFDQANKNLTKVMLFVDRTMSCMMPMMMFVMNCITVLILWNGSHGIDSGIMQIGDLMAFIQYTMQIIMAFLMISMISVMLPRALVSFKRINEVIETEEVIKDPKNPKKFNPKKKGLVEFRNVGFRYPDADEDVITGITFKAEPGKTTAFIGSTGSGKSTVINLIPRLFDVTSGEILVDGVNVKDVSQYDLHSIIGYVPQKGVLFSGTIDSNIRYGNQNATEEEVKKASRIAQAQEFIDAKPDKYESPISQGGTNVSGGQKQRLSIARAVAVNPEIYIFDDSFSALDFKTDAELRKALAKETKEATVLIVAQRISTIMHADQILVLDEGKVVGVGTHQELLKNCSVYQEIASSQLSKEELENE